MHNNENHAYFPLFWWCLVLFFVFLLAWLSHPMVIYIENKTYENGTALNLKRLNQPYDGEVIVALGSSLTERSYKFDDKMDVQLANVSLKNNFIRISAANATRSSFEKILPLIAKVKPRLVFVELEMLQTNHGPENELKKHKLHHSFNNNILKSVTWLKDKLLKFKSYDDLKLNGNYGFSHLCTFEYKGDKNTAESIAKLPQQKFTTYTERFSAPWMIFFDSIKQQGGQVILVEMGRSDYASKGLTEKYKTEFTRIKNEIITKEGLNIWQYPGPYTSDNYCDLAHLNPKGSENFTRWFIDSLSAISHD